MSTVIKFGLIDLTAKEDSKINIDNIQDFSNKNDLKSKYVFSNRYATLEKNNFLLDDSMMLLQKTNSSSQFRPVIFGIGICSKEMTNDTGVFNTSPVLTISFTEKHSSNRNIVKI